MLNARQKGVATFMQRDGAMLLVVLLAVGCRNRTQSDSQAVRIGLTSASASNGDIQVPNDWASPDSSTTVDAGPEGRRTTLDDSVCPAEMAYVPDGKLTRYAVNDPIEIPALCIDRFEVTAGEYGSCMAYGHCPKLEIPSANGCNLRKPGREGHPMNCVPWAAAKRYCESKRAQLPSFTYLLWATHNGPHNTKWPWGDEVPTESSACWRRVKLGSDIGTCAIGTHPRDKSHQGINDLAGSVAEWSIEEGRRRFDRLVVTGDYVSGNAEFVVGLVEDSEAESQTATRVGFRCVKKARLPISREPDAARDAG